MYIRPELRNEKLWRGLNEISAGCCSVSSNIVLQKMKPDYRIVGSILRALSPAFGLKAPRLVPINLYLDDNDDDECRELNDFGATYYSIITIGNRYMSVWVVVKHDSRAAADGLMSWAAHISKLNNSLRPTFAYCRRRAVIDVLLSSAGKGPRISITAPDSTNELTICTQSEPIADIPKRKSTGNCLWIIQ